MGEGLAMSGAIVLAVVVLAHLVPTPAAFSMKLHEACDFAFDGHHEFPPVLSLAPQSTFMPALISARDRLAVKAVGRVSTCNFFPVNSDLAVRAKCAEEFIFKGNQLSTRASEGLANAMKATGVVLKLSSINLGDDTRLTPGDGNKDFPESRRCVMFFSIPVATTTAQEALKQVHETASKLGSPGRKRKASDHDENARFRHNLRKVGRSFIGQD